MKNNRLERTKLVEIAILFLCFSLIGACTYTLKPSPEDLTQVCNNTYDEAFQASQQAMQQLGWYVTGADKDKGLIAANARSLSDLHIEVYVQTINNKPETRVTLDVSKITRGYLEARGVWQSTVRQEFFMELQKVLSAYK